MNHDETHIQRQTDSETEQTCTNCDEPEVASYGLILDGEQQISLPLCDECYASCYDSVLVADWIEEV